MSPVTPPTRRSVIRHRAGFTLMEVLVALGLFALGFVAIASMFPVGIAMQKQTTAEVIARHVAQNGVAYLNARGFEKADLPNYFTYSTPDNDTITVAGNENRVEPLLFNDAGGNPLLDRYSIFDRTYPSVVSVPADRDFTWVPLIQNVDPDGSVNSDTWQVFVLVLENRGGIFTRSASANPDGTNIPTVERRIPTFPTPNSVTFPDANLLSSGDIILDANGIKYTVIEVNGTTLTLNFPITNTPEWVYFAPPSSTGGSSPLKYIKQFVINFAP